MFSIPKECKRLMAGITVIFASGGIFVLGVYLKAPGMWWVYIASGLGFVAAFAAVGNDEKAKTAAARPTAHAARTARR